MMPTTVKILLATLTLYIFVFNPDHVWSDQVCKTCLTPIKPVMVSNEGDGTRRIGLDGIKCYKSGRGYSFDEGFCMAYFNVEGREDFERWINRCEHTDPQARSTIIEYMKTLKCDSEMIKSVAVKYPGAGIKESLIPLNQFMIYQDQDVAKVADFFRILMKSYRDEGKGRGYPELKEFVAVLNELDPNGMTFLDNVLLRWDEHFSEAVIFTNQRNRMIRNLCRVGARFSPSTEIGELKCNPIAEYLEN